MLNYYVYLVIYNDIEHNYYIWTNMAPTDEKLILKINDLLKFHIIRPIIKFLIAYTMLNI